MSNFAIEGLISGFNTTELINAMLDIQVRGPVKQLDTRILKEGDRLGAFQTLSASLLSVGISAGSLNSSSLFKGREAKSSNSDVVSVSANSNAELGNFSIQVQNLAQADQVSSKYFTDRSEELAKAGRFVVNGKTISVSNSDSLSSIANKISAANVGVRASVVQSAPNQNKLVLNSTSTGVDKIELREVGSSKMLEYLGLIDPAQTSYDYTVNAGTGGALSEKYNAGQTFSFTNQSFQVTDGGGQKQISVTLNGNLTLGDIATAINGANTAQGGKISASVIQDGTQERLEISSETGLPSNFVDNDNALFSIGILSGVQSEAFSSSTKSVADTLKLNSAVSGNVTLQAGDGTGEITVAINFDTDSLEDIADKINTAAAGAPPSTLSARVISAGGLNRLELTSGAGHPLVVSDASKILNTLGLVDNGFKNFDKKGENAQFSYNGVTVNRNTNLVTDLVEGVSLALLDESSTAANISINENHDNVGTVVQGFVDSFNKYASTLSELTFFDATGKNNGLLFGNNVVRELKSTLANQLSHSVPLMPSIKLSELNDGQGIDTGSIKITDRSGKSKVFDLTAAKTVQDVLDEINLQQDIQVKAEISSTGQCFNLIDQSGGVGAFAVEEVDGGTTAKDLGLRGSIYSNNQNGAIVYEGGATSLDYIGISLTAAGTLAFDSSKLEAALNEDPDKVKNLLTASQVGFAPRFQKTLSSYTAYGVGTLDLASKAITDRIESLNDQVERINSRAKTMETMLRKRFTALETTMAKSQNLSQFLSQKLSG